MVTPIYAWVGATASEPGTVSDRGSSVRVGVFGDEQFGVAGESPSLEVVLSEATVSGGLLDLTLTSGTRELGEGIGEWSGANGVEPDAQGLGEGEVGESTNP